MTCEERKQIGLEDILITEELYRRSPRTPDLQAENQALHTFARQLVESPQSMLKILVAVARDLCQAGTAGVSLLEVSSSGEAIFRWVAVTGVLEQYEQGTTSCAFSPCGVCLERLAPQLYLYPERYFTDLQQAKPAIIESLVIPLVIDEQPIGTIWIVSHDEQRHFDSEDVRLMTSFANITTAALQSSRARQAADDAQQALHQSQAQMQSLIRNMPGMVYRYIPGADGSDRFTFVNSGCRDLFEVEPSAALQDAGLIWNQIHPNDQPSFQASIATAVKNFLPWDWQGRIITPSGKLKWIQGRSNALQTEDGDSWDGLLIDITATKQVVEALHSSEELKQRILDSSRDCIKVLTLNSEILYISKGGLCLLEIDDPTSVLNTVWADRWQGEDYENASSAIAAARMGNTGQFQGYLPTAKGTPKWWDSMITPVRDASGQVVQLVAISRDITEAKRIEAERQQAEIALREAHVQLESALAAGAVYTWRWNIPTDRVIVNAAFAHLFGVDPVQSTTDGLPIELFIDAMHEEDRSRVWAAIHQAIKTGEGYAAEYRVWTVSGEERWLSARGRVEYDATGVPISFPGALVDITELKQAEAALQESEQKFSAIFNQTFQLIGRLTPDGILLEVNQAALDSIGVQQSDTFGKWFWETPWWTHSSQLQTQLRDAIAAAASGQFVRCEVQFPRASGDLMTTDFSLKPVFDEADQVVMLIAEGRDITDRKRTEAERDALLAQAQAARESAEQANRIKDEFLAVLSHELRSPLNPILGWSSLLRNGKLDAAQTAHALETIERNAKLQVQLIEDLLDVSRILRGKVSLNMARVNLALTIRAAMETVHSSAQAKSIRVKTVFENEVEQILGDSARLQQIIWNLLSNAVKFTPDGGQVEIQLNRIGSQAQIQVRDTGIGISPDFLPHVFEYFRQADSTTTRTFGGLGLGLAIVRHLVELHGGTVHADSPGVGQGTTFTVRLPLLKDKGFGHLDESTFSSLIPPSSSFPLADLRVLLVDDDTDTRDLIAFILEQSGALVTSATSAIEALQAFKQTNFDVLISDIGMPQMDGYMLMQQIRAITRKQGTEVMAIAMTAYAGEINQQQALAAGFQRHVAKPVDPEDVVKVIADLIKARV